MCHHSCDLPCDQSCNTIVYVKSLSPDNVFVYGQDGSMQASYTVQNVTDLEGNVIGNRRADIKTVTIPGSITTTTSGTTVLNDNTFVYFVATNQINLVSGGEVQTVYDNTVIQQVVVNGVTYTKTSNTIVPIPGANLAIVTIFY